MTTPAITPPVNTPAPQPPAPAQSPQQNALGDEGVPMVFKDGSTHYFPKNQVLQIVSSGDGEVGHDVSFPDGSRHIIPHENLAGAMQDGGKVLDPSYVRQQAENTPHEPTLGDYASIGLDTALMNLGGYPGAGAAPEAAQAASKMPNGIKTLMGIAKSTVAGEEVAGSEVAAKGWKEFADTAYQKAAEAIQSGDSLKAKAFTVAATASKYYSKYETAWAWVGTKFPGVPFGMKVALTAQAIKEGWDLATGSGGDKDDARDALFK